MPGLAATSWTLFTARDEITGELGLFRLRQNPWQALTESKVTDLPQNGEKPFTFVHEIAVFNVSAQQCLFLTKTWRYCTCFDTSPTHIILHMKLNPLVLFGILAVALSWSACEKNNPKGPDCNISNTDFSYTKNIKGIIDRQCVGCHQPGSGVPGAVGDYRTYNGLKAYLDNGKILQRVVIDKNMPQGGGMSQAERDSVNCWIAAKYPN